MIKLSPNIRRIIRVPLCLAGVFVAACTGSDNHAHDDHSHDHHPGGSAEFLAHAAVMVESGPTKILFDPIFDKDYGSFQLLAPERQRLLMAGQAPYDGVDAVFVSHAHGDHFAAGLMIDYLTANPQVKLVAPEQALLQMQKDEGWNDVLAARIHADPIALNACSDETINLGEADVDYTRLRLPHAGGARQAKVENIVYRVSLSSDATVMHLGDTDPDEKGLNAQSAVFNQTASDMAFVPVWFIGAANETSFEAVLNAEHVVGVHVPKIIPESVLDSDVDYFSKPGETREFGK